MPLFFRGLEDIREIEWGDDLNWEVKMPQCPPPFDGWLPATSVNLNQYTLTLETFDLFNNTGSVPLGTSEFDVSVTFVDDVYHTIEEYLSFWVNTTILNGGEYITPVRHAARELHIAKTLPHEGAPPVILHQFWVIPEGAGYFAGESQPQVPSREAKFIIVGGA